MESTAQPTERRRRVGRVVLAVVAGLAVVVAIFNWTWGDLPDEPEPTGSFTAVDGLRIRYLEHPGADPAVVLVHGMPGTADDFDAVTAQLSGRHTIAVDRPGYGYSTGGRRSFDGQVAALHDLLDRLGIERPIIVGHSWGGTVALAYADRHPDAVRGLVLVAAAAAGDRVPAFERAQARAVQALTLPVVRAVADATFSQALRRVAAEQGEREAFAPDPVDPRYERKLLAVTMQPDDLATLADEQLGANDALERLDERLRTIAAPAVVIQGRGDRLVDRSYGRRLAATLPRARLVLVPGGHMVPYVHPDVVARGVERLLPGGGGVAAVR